MKKNKQPTRKSNPSITWKRVKAVRIKSIPPGMCDLSAQEFVDRIKKNSRDGEVRIALRILLWICKMCSPIQAKFAKRILEEAGFPRDKIPKVAYTKRSAEHGALRFYQMYPDALLEVVDRIKEEIKPFFQGKKNNDMSAVRESCKVIVKRDITQEEENAFNKKFVPDRFDDIVIFLLVLREKLPWALLSFDSLTRLYYTTKTEINGLSPNSIKRLYDKKRESLWGLTDRPYQVGVLTDLFRVKKQHSNLVIL